jgi:hypothetical protein
MEERHERRPQQELKDGHAQGSTGQGPETESRAQAAPCIGSEISQRKSGMKRTFEIQVVGKSGANYGFPFKGDPQHLQGWLDEGFEVHEIVNTIPLWAQQLGLTHILCWVQDRWAWMRLW